MPEIDFILSPNEQRRLVKVLLDEDLVFVPSLRYTSARYAELRRAEEICDVANSLEMEGPFFLISPDFSEHRLEMVPLEWQGERRFFLRQRHGGPYMDLLPSRMRHHVTPPILTSGFCATYRTYWVGMPPAEVAAPPGVSNLMKFVAAWLRKSCRSLTARKTKRRYWVGPEALSCLRAGTTCSVQGLHGG
jgi:hypothetical protein